MGLFIGYLTEIEEQEGPVTLPDGFPTKGKDKDAGKKSKEWHEDTLWSVKYLNKKGGDKWEHVFVDPQAFTDKVGKVKEHPSQIELIEEIVKHKTKETGGPVDPLEIEIFPSDVILKTKDEADKWHEDPSSAVRYACKKSKS